ncbi:hypothetical protein ACFQU2_17700 [Siccirubricoccus deserti]
MQDLQARSPLNAVRLRNTGEVVLPDGLAAVFGAGGAEAGAYLGDAEIRALPPGRNASWPSPATAMCCSAAPSPAPSARRGSSCAGALWWSAPYGGRRWRWRWTRAAPRAGWSWTCPAVPVRRRASTSPRRGFRLAA